MYYLISFLICFTTVEQKIKAIEDQMKKEKIENELSMLKQKEEYERKLKELEEKMQNVTFKF
jgi:hypothetical protein